MSQNENARSLLREATCACGALRVTTTGRPEIVNACSCFDCQRRTGSAFSYGAFFPGAAVKIEGTARSWRHARASGRSYEAFFCPECGVTVYSRLEALPGLTCVVVGCFADPTFEPPQGFYWTSRRHHWLAPPEGIPSHETQ